jgi:hypothetical protein
MRQRGASEQACGLSTHHAEGHVRTTRTHHECRDDAGHRPLAAGHFSGMPAVVTNPMPRLGSEMPVPGHARFVGDRSQPARDPFTLDGDDTGRRVDGAESRVTDVQALVQRGRRRVADAGHRVPRASSMSARSTRATLRRSAARRRMHGIARSVGREGRSRSHGPARTGRHSPGPGRRARHRPRCGRQDSAEHVGVEVSGFRRGAAHRQLQGGGLRDPTASAQAAPFETRGESGHRGSARETDNGGQLIEGGHGLAGSLLLVDVASAEHPSGREGARFVGISRPQTAQSRAWATGSDRRPRGGGPAAVPPSHRGVDVS